MVVYIVLSFFSAMTFAKETFVEVKPVNCKTRAHQVITAAAKSMGLKGKFGVNLTRVEAGKDEQGRTLYSYDSGPFIVEEGYITGSGGSAVFRSSDDSCKVIKLTVSIGH